MLIVVAYHRIVDSRQTKDFYTSYDRGLDAKVFEAHLISLKRHFRLVDLGEFIKAATDPSGPQQHTALITFDDADADLQQHAIPLLKKHKVPAVVFAPVTNVDQQQQLWHVRISNLVKYATSDQWTDMLTAAKSLSTEVAAVLGQYELPPAAQRRPLSLAINCACDQIDHDTIDRLVEKWESIVRPQEEIPIRCTDWTELRQLQDDGLKVESHTLSHRKLTTLSDEEVQSELVDSKRVLEQQLQTKVSAIAYPQGYCNENVWRQAVKAGYKVGFTTERFLCSTPIEGLDLMRIPRVGLNGTTVRGVDLFLTKICAMSALFGSGKNQRQAI